MESEVAVVQLPPPLRAAIGRSVRDFAVSSQRVTSIDRWHGADLWMLHTSDHSPRPSGEVPVPIGFDTRRVTIAAYTDRPDDLVFTPDVVVHTLEGRYVPSASERSEAQRRLSIFNLMQRLLTVNGREDDIIPVITESIEAAWQRTERFAGMHMLPAREWLLLP